MANKEGQYLQIDCNHEPVFKDAVGAVFEKGKKNQLVYQEFASVKFK